jgi:hypothetical protein
MRARDREATGVRASLAEGQNGVKVRAVDAAGVSVLVALHFGLLWRAVLLRGFLIHSDVCYFFEPAKAFMQEGLRAGRLPLWSPYIFCGYPIAAEGQIAAFYPPSLLLSWLLPSPAVVNWLIITHLLLAAISMYLLARALGLSPFGALLSALVFSFSGYLFAHIHHVSLICAAAWLPLTLLFVERAWRGALVPNAALAGLGWAASALCGHPQTLFYISLGALCWIIWRLVQAGRAGEARCLRRAGLLVGMVFVLGCGLAAVQLLMTAELAASAPHGERGDISYVTSFSLLPKHLIGLFAPNWQGTPAFNTYQGERYYWEYVLYIGLAPLLLAVIGTGTRRGRGWGAVALLALVLALAQGNPVYQVLRFIPGFSHFRVPARFIFLFTFAVALAAAYGWEAVSELRWLARGRRLAICGAAIGALAVLDLLSFDRTLAPLASPEVYQATPRVVQALKQDGVWGRSLILPPIPFYADWLPPGGWAKNPDGWIEARVYLPADVAQSFGLRIIDGYAGFIDAGHKAFFDWAMMELLRSGDVDLLSLVGTRHVVAGGELKLPSLSEERIPPFTVYANPEAFPRAFAVGDIVPVRGEAQALEHTIGLARAGRLRDAAVVRGGLGEFKPEGKGDAVLRVEELRPEHIVVRAEANGDVLLVLNERWDGGWRARVDGRPAPLIEVDTVLMGAPLPAGEHTVEFIYLPRGLIAGRAISLTSLLVLLILLMSGRVLRRGRGPS